MKNPQTERFKQRWKERDDQDKKMIDEIASKYNSEEERKAFIEGYNYSRMQPAYKVIYEVAMYVLDYFPRYKGDYAYQAEQIYKIFRELHPNNEYVQSKSWN